MDLVHGYREPVGLLQRESRQHSSTPLYEVSSRNPHVSSVGVIFRLVWGDGAVHAGGTAQVTRLGLPWHPQILGKMARRFLYYQ